MSDKTCEQCGAPLLDGKCSVDGDFDYEVDQEAFAKLVEDYLWVWDHGDAENFEKCIDHDFGDDETLRNKLRTSVLTARGIAQSRS